MRDFFDDVKGTVRKLSHPGKKETAALAAAAIIVSGIAAAVLSVVGLGMEQLLGLLF